MVILLASVGLMLAITFGGWSELQGLTPVNFAWSIAYLVIAFYVWRWARGLLPIAAALAVLLLIVAVIAGVGASGASWFARSAGSYQAAHSLFGGAGLSAGTLGLLTVLLAPVQALLIWFALRAFAQGWNVEVEAPLAQPAVPTGRDRAAPGGRTRPPAATPRPPGRADRGSRSA